MIRRLAFLCCEAQARLGLPMWLWRFGDRLYTVANGRGA